MSIRSLLKPLIFTLTPDLLLQRILRVYYLRTLKMFHESREIDFKVLRYLVAPGATVLDVGANIGIYTAFLSKLVGGQGSVYSVEPVPLTFDLLSNNVKKMGLSNVSVLNYALSGDDRAGIMEIPKDDNSKNEDFYQARIVDEAEQDSSLRSYKVNIRSLDSLFLSDLKELSFVKIDVEGFELSVISGAKKVVERFKPAFLIEISSDPDCPGSDASKIFEELAKEDYRPYWFDGNLLRHREVGDTTVNYFFLTDEQLARCSEIVAK